MGIKVWKEVLCLGEQIDPRTKRRFKITPKKIRDAHRNFQTMFSRGIPVPAVWEHQDIEAADAPPDADKIAEWKRNYARYTFAHLEDSRINDRGNLDMLHDVGTEEDAERLPLVKFCSPKIYEGYWDSKGGTYDGTTIAHVAATPTPVQFWQKPFELSDSDVLYLSYCPPDLPRQTPSICPREDVPVGWMFDEWLDSLDPAPRELSTTPEESAVADDKKDDAPKKDDGGSKPGGGKSTLEDVIKALRDTGMNIPEEVEDEAGLVIAIKAANGQTPAEAEVEDENPATAESGDTTAAGGPPMMMSTTDKNPTRRKQAQAWAKEERTDAAVRINDALSSGRLSPPEARKLLRRVESHEMSFTDGEPSSDGWKKLLAEIEAAEKKPARKKTDPPRDLSTTEAPAPNFAGAMTSERAGVVTDVILGKKPVTAA